MTTGLLNQICQATLDALKQLSREGKGLTEASLYNALKQQTTLIRAIQAATVMKPKTAPDAASPESGSVTPALSEEIETLKFQKDALFKQLNQEGALREQSDRFYTRCVTTLLDLCRTDTNPALNESFSRFKKQITSETGIERLEQELNQLRERALKSEIDADGPESKKTSRFIGRLLRSDKPEDVERFISQLREGYQDLINGLGRYLDEEYLGKLQMLSRSIQAIRSLPDYLDVRNDLLAIISDYTENVSAEREYVTGFVKEIWRRVADVDSFLLEYLSGNDADWEHERAFHQVLNAHLDDLAGKTRLSQTLEDLKQKVAFSLEGMKNAIEKKYQQDQQTRVNTNEKLGDLQDHLNQLKQEVVTAREHADALKKEVYTDPLTGAHNRRSYDKKIQELVNLFQRYNTPFSAIIFDVDHFKKINDRFGHTVGDKCLKEIIKRIQPTLREVDFLFRFGGEEFVILLPETGQEGAVTVAEKTRQTVEKIAFIHKGDTVKITISLGVTTVAEGDSVPESIFNRMDAALYAAKNNGRNRSEVKCAD
ncbi:MAG: hypothetical protein CSA22_10520 [Deltaproteobacteria bacterium]|nr:MAG: hypothetical protein CSA22_10520 [Deltaproteobacteria bacterium]